METLEAELGLSPFPSPVSHTNSEHSSHLKGVTTARLPVAVQPPNENDTGVNDINPHIEIDLGRTFLDFIRENQDLVKAYTSRRPNVELDLAQKFLRFTSENQNVVQAFISFTNRVPRNTPPPPSHAVAKSPRKPSDSNRTISDWVTSLDDSENDADHLQLAIDLNSKTRSQHIAAAMKATGYTNSELLASYSRGEVQIGGQWAHRVKLSGLQRCDRCRRLEHRSCVQFRKEDTYFHGLACVGCRSSKVGCSLTRA